MIFAKMSRASRSCTKNMRCTVRLAVVCYDLLENTVQVQVGPCIKNTHYKGVVARKIQHFHAKEHSCFVVD